MKLRTCVAPSGQFVYNVHKPRYNVDNLRESDTTASLGALPDGTDVTNQANYPRGNVGVADGEWIYEIPNAFPFRGATYILKSWADAKAADPNAFSLSAPKPFSFRAFIREHFRGIDLGEERLKQLFKALPEPLQLTLAVHSNDPEDLVRLAESICGFVRDHPGKGSLGLRYTHDSPGQITPGASSPELFEALANNRHLPDVYKDAMVLRPGVQGSSEIIGEWSGDDRKTHVFEYLRRNSYIPWGHYGANMANDAIRYRIKDLTPSDMRGLRHLYYQRTYIRLAHELGIASPASRGRLSEDDLEILRQKLIHRMKTKSGRQLSFSATLWGWNYGFDFSSSGYRLHASHQQVHQQYALIPAAAETCIAGEPHSDVQPPFHYTELVGNFCRSYKEETGEPFFDAYLGAIRSNRRLDGSGKGDAGASSLVVYEDDDVMLFVPKAQTSQWELQLVTLSRCGNILEIDSRVREAVDTAILLAMKLLEAMGAALVTVIEIAKPFVSADEDQRLLYCFLPRMPQSPGAFSEAQLRWINGHYPEDFAAACRSRILPAADGDL